MLILAFACAHDATPHAARASARTPGVHGAPIVLPGAPLHPPPPVRPADSGPSGLLVAQDWAWVDAPLGAGAGHYRVIFLQESMADRLPDIRAANPEAHLLAYQKVGGMRADGGDHPSTGVTIGEAAESWFLHDSDGNRLYYCDYADVAAANIGDPGYQARWLTNVRARLARDGFDGAMMDDVNTFPGHCLGDRGTPIAEYATDAAYGAAVVAFLHAVGPELMADGLLVAPNVALNPWEDDPRELAREMLPDLTHFVREYWMRWDDSANFTGDEWASTRSLFEEVEAAGVGFLALTYGPGAEGSEAGRRYGRGSWLLAWDGEADSAWGYWEGAADPYVPDWGPDIGLPRADAVEDGPCWRRWYTHGAVVVDPDPSEPCTISLDRTYEHPELGYVEAVTLGPGEAVILIVP